MKKILALTLTLALGNIGLAQDFVSPAAGQGIEASSLLARLQSGGLVILFRHGKTGANPDGPNVVSPASTFGSAKERQAAYFDCARQRNLSDEGRAELRGAALAIHRVGFVISEVVSSPLCRTRETAWLLFGQVTPNDALAGPDNPERRTLAGTIPASGANRVLVTHSRIVRSMVWFSDDPIATGELIPEGHGFVLEPDGNGEYQILARLGPDDWSRLADLAER